LEGNAVASVSSIARARKSPFAHPKYLRLLILNAAYHLSGLNRCPIANSPPNIKQGDFRVNLSIRSSPCFCSSNGVKKGQILHRIGIEPLVFHHKPASRGHNSLTFQCWKVAWWWRILTGTKDFDHAR
jgi:hypothetical protein